MTANTIVQPTPGPWEVRPVPRLGVLYIARVGHLPHADVFEARALHTEETPEITPQVQADARLIAAAPTMLVALRRIADMTDRDGNPIAMHPEELRAIANTALAEVEIF